MWETWVQSLGSEDPLENSWRIPRTVQHHVRLRTSTFFQSIRQTYESHYIFICLLFLHHFCLRMSDKCIYSNICFTFLHFFAHISVSTRLCLQRGLSFIPLHLAECLAKRRYKLIYSSMETWYCPWCLF